MISVNLATTTSFNDFREAARRLIARDCPPDLVCWDCADTGSAGLLDAVGKATLNRTDVERLEPSPSSLSVPRSWLRAMQAVALHTDPERFGLMYRILWRLQHGLVQREDCLDEDVARLHTMAKSVSRDMHKMKAFVRFRVATDTNGVDWYIAWFEPEHYIVNAIAPFFVRRFARMNWVIVTPYRSVMWDGSSLHFADGGNKFQVPQSDATEALWLTYYESIFNPARLKLKAMQKEMPMKYWRNLPEASLISTLAQSAQARTNGLIDAAPCAPLSAAKNRAWQASPRARQQSARCSQESDEPETLATKMNACRQCAIGACATQAVPGRGAVPATIMIVGEQPGDEEDLQGEVFVGPAGRLLSSALARLNWPLERLYLTNAVKHFKYQLRGKRRLHKTPAQKEILACAPWLAIEIERVKPALIVALGSTAVYAVTGRIERVTQMRGCIVDSSFGIPTLITLHPAALLRSATPLNDLFGRWLQDFARAEPYLGSVN